MIGIAKKDVLIQSQGGINVNYKDNKSEYDFDFGKVEQDKIPCRPFVQQFTQIGPTASWKTPVSTIDSLPTTGNVINDVRIVENGGNPRIYVCISSTGPASAQWEYYNPFSGNHNDLLGIQGGETGYRIHLTLAEYSDMANKTWTTALVESASGQVNEHNELQGIQGGDATHRLHLTQEEYDDMANKTWVSSLVVDASANSLWESQEYTDAAVYSATGLVVMANVIDASANAYNQSVGYTNTLVESVSSQVNEHNELQGKQGGDTDEYYHLSESDYLDRSTKSWVSSLTEDASANSLLKANNYTLSLVEAVSSQVNEHNELGGIQGGGTNDYYHLTLADYTDRASKTWVNILTNSASGEAYNQIWAKRGIPNGIASLDGSGLIPLSQIPTSSLVLAVSSTDTALAIFNGVNGQIQDSAYITWNRFTQTLKLIQIGSDATSYATQSNSGIIYLEGSNWNGSSETKGYATLQLTQRTDANSPRLSIGINNTERLRIDPSVVLTLANQHGIEFASNSTSAPLTSASIYIKNTNSTVGNFTAFVNKNYNGMYTGGLVFKNTSHSATLGASDLEIWLSDFTTAGRKYSLTSGGTFTFHASGADATGYADQKSSGTIAFETSQWTGSVAQKRYWYIQSIPSTTGNSSVLSFKDGTSELFSINNGGAVTSYTVLRTVVASTATSPSALWMYINNSNSTVNNYATIGNRNSGSMFTGYLAFKNTSHHATTGSAEFELLLSNGGVAATVINVASNGAMTCVSSVQATKFIFATGVYAEYNAGTSSIDFIVV